MCTERRRPSAARCLAAWLFAAASACAVAAQNAGETVLSSPLGTPAPTARAAQDAPMLPGTIDRPGLPPGSGPGFHDPRSPFKPLEEREGVVPWSLLANVTTKPLKNRVQPVFPAPVKALDRQTVKVQGFMMPLDPGERQKHFLLSAVPTTCSFCVPAGPEGLVQVRTERPVRYGIEPVVVEGRMEVLEDDPFGVYYRITGARQVQ